MRILFLDDNAERTKRFQAAVPSAWCCETASGMIALLHEPADLVFLDHDLGDEVYVDSNRPDCGMEVVRWVEEHKPTVGRFIVHTCNEPAGREMGRRLYDAGYKVMYEPWIRLNLNWVAERVKCGETTPTTNRSDER